MNEIANAPIGFFDSGIGGISIWRQINQLLPHENTVYLADGENAPYGPKGKEKIIALSIKNTSHLIKRGCKLIVVACNTATTNAIDYLREHYNIPFVGIEPAIKPAALYSRKKTIGILATKGTLSSELFSKTSSIYTSGIKIVEQEGNGLVDLIESGKLNSKEMTTLLKMYLNPMIRADIDCLVLGCTHYVYLMPQIEAMLPKEIKIVDSGKAVARQVKNVLKKKGLLNNKERSESLFFTNTYPKILQEVLPHGFTAKRLNFGRI